MKPLKAKTGSVMIFNEKYLHSHLHHYAHASGSTSMCVAAALEVTMRAGGGGPHWSIMSLEGSSRFGANGKLFVANGYRLGANGCLLLVHVPERQRPHRHVHRRRLREGKQAV